MVVGCELRRLMPSYVKGATENNAGHPRLSLVWPTQIKGVRITWSFMDYSLVLLWPYWISYQLSSSYTYHTALNIQGCLRYDVCFLQSPLCSRTTLNFQGFPDMVNLCPPSFKNSKAMLPWWHPWQYQGCSRTPMVQPDWTSIWVCVIEYWHMMAVTWVEVASVTASAMRWSSTRVSYGQ